MEKVVATAVVVAGTLMILSVSGSVSGSDIRAKWLLIVSAWMVTAGLVCLAIVRASEIRRGAARRGEAPKKDGTRDPDSQDSR